MSDYRPGPIEPSPRTDVGAELDEALSCEIVEIELQSVQASSVTRARHCCATPIFAADRLQKSQQKLVSKIDAGACPLHLKKPTFHEAMIMSALGHKLNSAAHFDQLVGAGEQRGGAVRFWGVRVLRLTTSSYVAGSYIGRSIGFAHAVGRHRSLRVGWHRRRRFRLSPDRFDPPTSRCDEHARNDLRSEQR